MRRRSLSPTTRARRRYSIFCLNVQRQSVSPKQRARRHSYIKENAWRFSVSPNETRAETLLSSRNARGDALMTPWRQKTLNSFSDHQREHKRAELDQLHNIVYDAKLHYTILYHATFVQSICICPLHVSRQT